MKARMDSQQVRLDSLEDLLDVMAVGNPFMQRMLSERRAALGLPGWIALDNPYNIPSSEDPITQSLIKEEVHKWQKEGARIVYRHRVNREGYKAGNLKSSMNCSFVKDYITMSIFDADFQLLPDFLKKKNIPHFKDNEEKGLVQER
ncbi:BnaA09g53890D [Brassica napus]|uniref:BnaA09g53890D protein n=1 Tax=Brassica napus TaxID=3708 RepID=A0A078GUD4_BRANA|nr:BnaA09g53890D [Brassica napus]